MSSARGELAKLRALSRTERGLLAQALAALPVAVVLLRLVGYRRVEQLVLRSALPATPSGASELAKQAARMVDLAASRLPITATCLPKSVVLLLLLRRRGIDASVCLGARRGEQDVDAHAWVELDGSPVNDAPDVAEHFALLHSSHRP